MKNSAWETFSFPFFQWLLCSDFLLVFEGVGNGWFLPSHCHIVLLQAELTNDPKRGREQETELWMRKKNYLFPHFNGLVCNELLESLKRLQIKNESIRSVKQLDRLVKITNQPLPYYQGGGDWNGQSNDPCKKDWINNPKDMKDFVHSTMAAWEDQRGLGRKRWIGNVDDSGG